MVIKIAGVLLMLLSVISWINAIIISGLLVKTFDFPIFGLAYLIGNFFITVALIELSTRFLGIKCRRNDETNR